MSKNPFAPNANGVVVVTLLKTYGSNVAGEKAGFMPGIAKALVKEGIATLSGYDAGAAKKASPKSEAPEVTTRKFQPRKEHPLDGDGDGKAGGSLPAKERDICDDLRAEYKAITETDADMRWGEERLQQEIKKAKNAKAKANG